MSGNVVCHAFCVLSWNLMVRVGNVAALANRMSKKAKARVSDMHILMGPAIESLKSKESGIISQQFTR